MPKNKHLTDEERLLIENWLKEGVSLNSIADALGKNRSTISREIRNRTIESDKSAVGRIPNRCIMRRECIKCQICYDKPDCTRRCSTCKLCNSLCDDFEEEVCCRLYDPPYCCNGCDDERKCTLKKRYYYHRKAHEAYRETLVESRTGANITEDELLALDTFVSPLLRQGQSPHHIVANNPDQFTVCEKSIYRYVAGNLLSAKNIDLPRVVRINPRKSKPVQHKVDSKCRINRTYPEFLRLVEQKNPNVVEMDSVIGRIGGKVLLTLMFKSCDFMIALIRDRNTSQSVIGCFDWMFREFGEKHFKAMFSVLLGDNGSEFSNPNALEFDTLGNRRTNVFYCDPQASFQKPHVELNHEFIRRVLPKGYSFDHLVQEDINLMMSHINSYSREKLNDKAPLDIFATIYGHDIVDKLGYSRIPANDIVLKPSLLRRAPASPGSTEPLAIPLCCNRSQQP
jgi:IS30 family transposase